jgi:P4 family phage/plasmid primase-like protien
MSKTALHLPVQAVMPPCIEHAIRYGPAYDDYINWCSMLGRWWKSQGADIKTLHKFIKLWYNDSDTTEDLTDAEIEDFTQLGYGTMNLDGIDCHDFWNSDSFRQGCNKFGCHCYKSEEDPKIFIPKLERNTFIGQAKNEPVNLANLSEELVRQLNIKRLPGGVLAVYNNGIYITEDSEYLIDTIVRNYLKNEMNTKLRSNLLMHIKALADTVIWDDFERYPHLLCCPNGVVDLTTGELMEHNPAYMMLHKTRAPYKPEAQCVLWTKILNEIVLDVSLSNNFGEVKERQLDYYKTVWGCSITGETRDEIVPIHQGAGASGKTTITSAIQYALGQYVQQVDPDILVTKGDIYKPSYELATGVGKRIFLTNESKEGAKINSQLIKMIATEGAEFNARQIREKPFTYTLRAKAHLVMNPPPILDEQDKSIQRRLHLIKYDADFNVRPDKTLKKRLQAEASGILGWLVEGAIQYYKIGITPTQAVANAVQELFESSDPLFGFLDANIEKSNLGDKLYSDSLFKAFKTHCGSMCINSDKFDPRPFGRALNAELKMRGWKIKTYRSNGKTVYQGLKYKTILESE